MPALPWRFTRKPSLSVARLANRSCSLIRFGTWVTSIWTRVGYRRQEQTVPLDLANAIRPLAILKEQAGEVEEAKSLWKEPGNSTPPRTSPRESPRAQDTWQALVSKGGLWPRYPMGSRPHFGGRTRSRRG